MVKARGGVGALDPEALEAHSDEAARLLKALANPQRLRILCLLSEGEQNVGQLNRQLPQLSQSALSQHLARLRDEGLVTTRRESQTIWYSLPPGPAGAVIATLYGIYCESGGGSAPRRPGAGARSASTQRRGRVAETPPPAAR